MRTIVVLLCSTCLVAGVSCSSPAPQPEPLNIPAEFHKAEGPAVAGCADCKKAYDDGESWCNRHQHGFHHHYRTSCHDCWKGKKSCPKHARGSFE